MNCPHCGTVLPSASVFCGNCGLKLAPAPQPAKSFSDTILDVRSPFGFDLERPASPPPQPPSLLGQMLSLGRSKHCSIQLPEPGVSLEHATLVREEEALLLTDLGSKNGTYVDGERVVQARVRPGNEIRLGIARVPWEHPKLKALSQGLAQAAVERPKRKATPARLSSPPPAPAPPAPAAKSSISARSLRAHQAVYMEPGPPTPLPEPATELLAPAAPAAPPVAQDEEPLDVGWANGRFRLALLLGGVVIGVLLGGGLMAALFTVCSGAQP